MVFSTLIAPLLIQVGEDEILRNDSLRMADKVRATGVDVCPQCYLQWWHVFQAHAGMLKVADYAQAQVAGFEHEAVVEGQPDAAVAARVSAAEFYWANTRRWG